MPWVRFDDQYPIHRKVDGLTDAAFRLHTSAIFWCARNLTDGFVSREDLDGVTARVRTPSRFAAECVARGLWHPSGEDCPSEKCPASVENSYPQGWVVHDYWVYQPTKAHVMEERQASAGRQRKWRAASRNALSQHNGSSNAVTNAGSKPAPSRRDGSTEKRTPVPSRGAARASPPGPPAAAEDPWCGQCDKKTHQREDSDGRPYRCPECHPLAIQAALSRQPGRSNP